MNEVLLFGKLTKDPELRKSKNGKSYMWGSIAVKKKFKSKDDPTRNTLDFISFTAFGGVAESIANHAKKGTYMTMKGNITTSKKTKGSLEYYSTDFIPEMVEIVFGTGESEEKPAEVSLPDFDDVDISEIKPEDIPF